MKNVLYVAVEFTDESDLVDNLIKAGMEAEDLWLDKKGPSAICSKIELDDGKHLCTDIEIGKAVDVSLVNLFPECDSDLESDPAEAAESAKEENLVFCDSPAAG